MGLKQPNLTELQDPEKYLLIRTIAHQDMLPFIQEQFQKRNFIIHLFVLFNLALLTAASSMSIHQVLAEEYPFWKMLIWSLVGAILGSTLIIPVHEAIHGLTYYFLGAKKVKYGWNPKQFYFFAVADRFIVNKVDIWPLALAPFFLITGLGIFGIYHVQGAWQWLLWGFVCMHSLNCIGDFGILSFFWDFRKHSIYTFDLVKDSVSFIYLKK